MLAHITERNRIVRRVKSQARHAPRRPRGRASHRGGGRFSRGFTICCICGPAYQSAAIIGASGPAVAGRGGVTDSARYGRLAGLTVCSIM
jgi:hypothetical protein